MNLFTRLSFKLANRIFTLLLSTAFPLFASTIPVKFEHLSSTDGLSQNSVYAIIQDSDGFMWFGTRFGLNRYDGKAFKIFPHVISDSTSLPSHRAISLCEDQYGNLWVGTLDGGIARYDKHKESFTRYLHDPAKPHSLVSNYINFIFNDSRGQLWVGTNKGLSRYIASTDSFEYFQFTTNDNASIGSESFSAMAEMPDSNLWLGSDNGSVIRINLVDYSVDVVRRGSVNNSVRVNCLLADPERDLLWVGLFGNSLYKLDPNTGSLKSIGYQQSRTESMIAGIKTLSMDKNGALWIGTTQSVTCYDPDRETFQVFRANKSDPDALQDDIVHSSYIDPQGNIWIGTEAGGISKYSPGLIRFNHIKGNTDSSRGILSDRVFFIAEDHRERIWFGTAGGGASVLDRETGIHTNYTSDDSKTDWSRNFISKVLPVNDNTTWLGTFQCGLFELNPEDASFILHRNLDHNPKSFADHTVYALLEDREGTIWIGTQTKGLDRFNDETNTFTHYRHDPDNINSISSDFIYCLLEDKHGFIWVGTADEGLSRMDPLNNTFKHFNASNNDLTLNAENILSLYEDGMQNLWIGTRGGGLSRLSPGRDRITKFDLGFGSQASTIYSILQDDQKYLWLSTDKGILKAHPDSGLVRQYTISDGTLQEFYYSSGQKASDGTMYFGGIDGYNVFHPDSIKDNTHIPPIVLTGLSINYEPVQLSVQSDDQTRLRESITFTHKLELSYKDKVVRFSFASLDYSASYKNQYSYKLDGYDKEWIYADTRNSAQYMNLPAGRYTFRVRGTNNDGLWNTEGTSVSIIISPPFWRTWWFKIALTLSLLGFTLLYIQLRTAKLKSQQIKLEALVRERSSQLKGEIEERQRIETEKTQLRMDHLKRELLTQTLHLNDKQQIMDNMQTELEQVCDQKPEIAKPKLQKLLRFLKDRSSVKQGWEDFELWFTNIHTGFYTELRQTYPDLSESELKVCALLRLNLISKDIAKVMNVQPTSIDIYRHRIRKKIQLPSEENLSTFLSQF